jgi:hypothetical protein
MPDVAVLDDLDLPPKQLRIAGRRHIPGADRGVAVLLTAAGESARVALLRFLIYPSMWPRESARVARRMICCSIPRMEVPKRRENLIPDYRRHRVPGGCFFFTINLLERVATTC